METKPYNQRDLRICYLNSESRFVDRNKMLIEAKIKVLGEVEIIHIDSIDSPSLKPCDLLIIEASQFSNEEFPQWLSGLQKRLIAQGSIWIPALIISSAPFETLNSILPDAIAQNWYFDILNPDHVDSLPIRVANMLRIHDHLHEIDRYQQTLQQLQQTADSLAKQVQTMQEGGK